MGQLLIGGGDGLPAAQGELRLLLQLLRDRFDAGHLIAKHSARAATEMTQSNNGRLFDYLAGDRLALETIVARRQEIHCVREDAEGRPPCGFTGRCSAFLMLLRPRSIASSSANSFP
jgi:hypothetical protein